ncbi:MAG: hypothetical protein EBT22_00330 [Chloroflexi bacterium]|nr:hypothetical protein [Chloroflexota bacterium]
MSPERSRGARCWQSPVRRPLWHWERERSSVPRKITVSLAVAATEMAVYRNLRGLAERLDLELVGVVAVPAALGSAVRTNVPPSGAVVIDIGAGSTTIARIGQGGTELSLSVPIGTNALEDHLVAESGLTSSQSRETLRPSLHRSGVMQLRFAWLNLRENAHSHPLSGSAVVVHACRTCEVS